MKLKVVALLLGGMLFGVAMGATLLWITNYSSSSSSSQNGAGISNTILQKQNAPSKGLPLQDFNLKNLDGVPVKLSQYRGHPVIINFWATWCEPCKDEMPLLEKTYEDHSGNLVILGINIEETPNVITPFIQKYQISFPILMDSAGEIQNRYLVPGFPTSFFADSNGILQAEHIGVLNQDLLSSYLNLVGVK